MSWSHAGSVPFEAVYNVEAAKMVGAKENNQLLAELLHVHIAPASKQAIIRAMKEYKGLKAKKYSTSEEELAKRLPVEDVPPPTPIVVNEAADDEESKIVTGDSAATPEAPIPGE